MWDDQGRNDGRPKSYLIELLVIKAYEDCLQSSQQMYAQCLLVSILLMSNVAVLSQELWEPLHCELLCQMVL